MNKNQIRRLFVPGMTVTVTNHYITRPDHPCFGTRVRTVAKVTASHLHFDETGSVPWPKAADLRLERDTTVRFYGHPKPGDLFLTIAMGRVLGIDTPAGIDAQRREWQAQHQE